MISSMNEEVAANMRILHCDSLGAKESSEPVTDAVFMIFPGADYRVGGRAGAVAEDSLAEAVIDVTRDESENGGLEYSGNAFGIGF